MAGTAILTCGKAADRPAGSQRHDICASTSSIRLPAGFNTARKCKRKGTVNESQPCLFVRVPLQATILHACSASARGRSLPGPLRQLQYCLGARCRATGWAAPVACIGARAPAPRALRPAAAATPAATTPPRGTRGRSGMYARAHPSAGGCMHAEDSGGSSLGVGWRQCGPPAVSRAAAGCQARLGVRGHAYTLGRTIQQGDGGAIGMECVCARGRMQYGSPVPSDLPRRCNCGSSEWERVCKIKGPRSGVFAGFIVVLSRARRAWGPLSLVTALRENPIR